MVCNVRPGWQHSARHQSHIAFSHPITWPFINPNVHSQIIIHTSFGSAKSRLSLLFFLCCAIPYNRIFKSLKTKGWHTSCNKQCAMCMAEVYFPGNLVTTVSDKFVKCRLSTHRSVSEALEWQKWPCDFCVRHVGHILDLWCIVSTCFYCKR